MMKRLLTSCQICGPPGNKKSYLGRLLQAYISKQEPATKKIWVQGWPLKLGPRWEEFFKRMRWARDQQAWFLFEAILWFPI